jgi:hypothetical protein
MKTNKIVTINLIILLFWIFLFNDGKIANNNEAFVLFFLYTLLICIDYFKTISYLKYVLILYIICSELFFIKSFLTQGIDTDDFILITASVASVLIYYTITALKEKRIFPKI